MDKNALMTEAQCNTCVHATVCAHKKDFLDIVDAIENTRVHRGCEEGVRMIPIENFECLCDISVRCRYYYARSSTTLR